MSNEHRLEIVRKSYHKNKHKYQEAARKRASEHYYSNRDTDIRKSLFRAAQNRATKFGIEFTIKIDDIIIPEVCPILGTPFEKYTATAASLDRVHNDKGYTPTNIAVISRRANTLKGNMSPELLRRIADWIESH